MGDQAGRWNVEFSSWLLAGQAVGFRFAVGCWVVIDFVWARLRFAVYESGNECLLWHERAFLCRQSEFLCITVITVRFCVGCVERCLCFNVTWHTQLQHVIITVGHTQKGLAKGADPNFRVASSTNGTAVNTTHCAKNKITYMYRYMYNVPVDLHCTGTCTT